MHTVCTPLFFLLNGMLIVDTDYDEDILSEVKKPKQRLKYSTFGALSLVSLSYLLTNIAYVRICATKLNLNRSPC